MSDPVRTGWHDHVDRTVTAMRGADVDVLLLGRAPNIRYVSGANQLSLTGTRAFAPSCVVVRDTGAVHLLSITDEGVPPEIPPANLYPLSWNPMVMVGNVAAVPGVAGATRVGVDAMTPLMDGLLRAALPGAELVDAEALLRELRRVKSDADLDGLLAAAVIARDGFDAVVAALRPGVREVDLKAVFEARMAAEGVTTPSVEGSFGAVFPGDRTLAAGDVVPMRAGVVADGWEATFARTYACGNPPGELRVRLDRVLAACRPGTTVGALRGAATGVTVDGLGLGHEELADADVLEPGMVLAVERVDETALTGQIVVVTPTGHEVL